MEEIRLLERNGLPRTSWLRHHDPAGPHISHVSLAPWMEENLCPLLTTSREKVSPMPRHPTVVPARAGVCLRCDNPLESWDPFKYSNHLASEVTGELLGFCPGYSECWEGRRSGFGLKPLLGSVPQSRGFP